MMGFWSFLEAIWRSEVGVSIVEGEGNSGL